MAKMQQQTWDGRPWQTREATRVALVTQCACEWPWCLVSEWVVLDSRWGWTEHSLPDNGTFLSDCVQLGPHVHTQSQHEVQFAHIASPYFPVRAVRWVILIVYSVWSAKHASRDPWHCACKRDTRIKRAGWCGSEWSACDTAVNPEASSTNVPRDAKACT